MKGRIVGFVGLLLALALLILTTREGDELGDSQAGVQPEGVETNEPAQGASLPTAETGQRANGEVQRVPVASEQNVSFESPLASGRPIQVLAEVTSLPLPGAEVAFLSTSDDYSDEGDLLRRCLTQEDPEQYLNEKGKRYRADAQGQLFVPEGNGIVMGRSGELWNVLELRGDPLEATELRLLPDTSITFRVRTSEGLPAGRVGTSFLHDTDTEPHLADRRYSDRETGTVTYEHIGRKVQEARRGLFGGTGRFGEYTVVCLVFLREPVVYVVDPDQLPTGIVDLVLPPTGSIEIQAVGAGIDLPLRGRVHTELTMTGVDAYDAVRSMMNWEGPHRVVNAEGHASYERVGLGLEFFAELQLPNHNYGHLVTGPTSPGESVRVEIEATVRDFVLSLQLLREDMGIAPNLSVNLRIHGSDTGAGSLFYGHPVSDGEGRLFANIEMDLVASQKERLRVDVYCTVDGEKLLGRTEWTPNGDARGVDLGPLVLVAPPLIASGSLLTEDGKPVPLSWVATTEAGKVVRKVYCDGNGLFDIRCYRVDLQACSPSGFVVLRAGGPGFRRLVLEPIPLGEEDIRLTLLPGGSVSGRLAFESPTMASDLDVVVWNEEGSYSASKVRDDGTFKVTALHAGTYELLVRLASDQAPLVRVAGLQVPEWSPCTDERLQAIPLPPLHEFEFTFVTPDEVPVREGNVAMRPAGDAAVLEDIPDTWFDGGYTRLLSTSRSIDVRISADRCMPRDLHGLTSGQRVVLQPYLRAVADLSGEPVSLPPNLRWKPTIHWAGPDPGQQDVDAWRYIWDQHGLVDERVGWHLPRAGTWEVRMEVVPQVHSEDLPQRVVLAPWRIEVQDLEAEQVFHLSEGERDFPQAVARAIELLEASD